MKTTILALILFLTALDVRAQMPPGNTPAPTQRPVPRHFRSTNATNQSRHDDGTRLSGAGGRADGPDVSRLANDIDSDAARCRLECRNGRIRRRRR